MDNAKGMPKGWTYDELQALPAITDIATAGRAAFGWGRARSYEEANKVDGLIPTIQVGERRRLVPTALLLRKMGLEFVGPNGSQRSIAPSPGRAWRTTEATTEASD